MDWTKFKHFTREEFDSPDLVGSGDQMDEKLILLLDNLREAVNFPLIITSGFRTEAHNNFIYRNRVKIANSAHLRGKAVDILCETSLKRFAILNSSFDLGFMRIEVAPRHIHLDIDKTLPQRVCVFLSSYE